MSLLPRRRDPSIRLPKSTRPAKPSQDEDEKAQHQFESLARRQGLFDVGTRQVHQRREVEGEDDGGQIELVLNAPSTAPYRLYRPCQGRSTTLRCEKGVGGKDPTFWKSRHH